MLSIIVSSYQTAHYDQLTKSISETIGTGFPYEIIQIWNPNLMGITQAYNLGAEKAKYSFLLFLHEDVLFHSQNWGEKLINHLSLPNTGVIGIAGSNYVPCAPSGWFVGDNENSFIYIMGTPTATSQEIRLKNSCPDLRNPVYGVDGVFMAVTKEVYSKIQFNKNLKGFHGYDLDFSLRTSRHYNNFIVNDILIQHLSFGKPDQQWLINNIAIRKETKGHYQKKNNSILEKESYLSFLYAYFNSYPINRRELKNVLQFYPLFRMELRAHIEVMKKLILYIVHRKEKNKLLS